MMSKEDHIKFWIENSEEDWAAAEFNLKAKLYVYALFLFHLSIEKLMKAHWVKDNVSNTPPFSHDLKFLSGQTDLELSLEDMDFLTLVNDWNISGRYPDYKRSLSKKATEEYMMSHFGRTERLRKCLLEKI
jgi:HEPN domain-containing protein